MTKPDQRAAALSRQLRGGRGGALARRRGVVALSLAASASMATIALYQIGLLRHLPEPPLPRLNADRIDAAPQAFRWLATGDAFLGLTSYSLTALLAAIGPPDRARALPLVPLGLAAKATVDAAQAARLSVDQWTRHRAFCAWCLGAAAATFALWPLTLPEAREAWGTVRRRGWRAALGDTLRGLA